MGLDQWVIAKAHGAEAEEIGYWRKHPDLHGWMENLWDCKRAAAGNPRTFDLEALSDYWCGGPRAGEVEMFNGVHLPLSEQDILSCMEAIREAQLPYTEGFFFGESEDGEEQRQEDLEIMERCLEAVRQGKEVFYDSSW